MIQFNYIDMLANLVRIAVCEPTKFKFILYIDWFDENLFFHNNLKREDEARK